MKYLLFFISICFFVGCGQNNHDYFPLGNDFRWEYVIEEKLNDTHKTSKSIVANLKSKKVNGLEYFPRANANGETYYFYKLERGIFLSPSTSQEGEIIFGFPLELGTSWQSGTRIELPGCTQL